MTLLKRRAAVAGLVGWTGGVVLAHEPETARPFERAHQHEAMALHAHTLWESRYASEGRDNLDGDPLWVTSAEWSWWHLSAGLWYGLSPAQTYDELQLSVGLTEEVGDFEFYVAYTHLRFPQDEAHDNEAGAGVLWSGLPLGLELGADVFYSFDAEGWFGELSAGRELEVGERLTLSASAVFGVNQGYVADGHDGANHVALRVGATFDLGRGWSVVGHVAQSWAIDRRAGVDGDELLDDFFHGGVGLQWQF